MFLMDVRRLKAILLKAGLRPKKKWGQHFLVDSGVIALEIQEAEIKSSETVLEIGPGLGALTKELACHAKFVFAIERDKSLAAALKKELTASGVSNVEIAEGDALRVDWPSFDKLVANIPYQISSGVIERLGRAQASQKSQQPQHGRETQPSSPIAVTPSPLAVLILQKEFAERLVAKEGEKNYGRITVLARFYFTPVLLQKIPASAFWPQPEVDSALVKLFPRRARPKVADERFFFAVVKALFQHPNQKAGKAFLHSRKEFSLGKDEAAPLGKKMPHAEKKVFQMSLEELAEAADYLLSKLPKGIEE